MKHSSKHLAKFVRRLTCQACQQSFGQMNRSVHRRLVTGRQRLVRKNCRSATYYSSAPLNDPVRFRLSRVQNGESVRSYRQRHIDASRQSRPLKEIGIGGFWQAKHGRDDRQADCPAKSHGRSPFSGGDHCHECRRSSSARVIVGPSGSQCQENSHQSFDESFAACYFGPSHSSSVPRLSRGLKADDDGSRPC